MWILINIFSYLVTNFNQNYNSCWNYLPSASVRTRQKSSSERFRADCGWRTRMADDVCVHIWTLLLKVMSAFISISVRGRCVRMTCAHTCEHSLSFLLSGLYSGWTNIPYIQWIVPHVFILSNQIAGIYLLRYLAYHRRHVVITSAKLKQ